MPNEIFLRSTEQMYNWTDMSSSFFTAAEFWNLKLDVSDSLLFLFGA